MDIVSNRLKRLRTTLTASASFLALGVIIAQAQTNEVLARVQVVGGSATTCSAIFISFNSSQRYASHTFSSDGNSVFIRLIGDADPGNSATRLELIETYPQLTIPGQGPLNVTLGPNGAASILVLQFSQNVAPRISQAGDSSIIISDIAPSGSVFCDAAPSITAAENDSERPIEDQSANAAPLPDASSSELASDETEADYAAARTAITTQNYGRAIQILTSLTTMPPHARSADSQELLGVVRERNGQLAHAKAEYEIYLETYPDSQGATRVSQRLAGILTAQAAPPEQLRDASSGFAGLPDAPLQPLDAQGPVRPNRGVRTSLTTIPEMEEKTFFASVSSYYYRNQGSTVLNEFSTGTSVQDDEVFQNTLVTSLDISDSKETDTHKFSWRIAGDHELDLADASAQGLSFSRAYGEVEFKAPGLTVKLGRQTRNGGGVFGRFDGALITWPVSETVTIDGVVGQPVDSASDTFFSSEKLIYGASATVTGIVPNVEATVYVIQQNVGSFVDRKAFGAEVQFLDDTTAIFAMLDYDLHFGRVNTARLTGTKIFADRSSVTLSADFTHSPLLTLSNALQGQAATTLTELNAAFSLGQIEQLALDRTTTTSSFTAAYSKPLNDDWQFSIDGSLFQTSGSPASGGVAAIPATGLEFYTSAQIVGTNIFSDSDVVSFSARYANTASSDLVLLDAYRRFDYTDALRLKPRLKVGYRDITSTGGTELFTIPSLTATYMMDDSTEFEIELGARFSNLDTPTFAEETNEFFAVAGFRKDF